MINCKLQLKTTSLTVDFFVFHSCQKIILANRQARRFQKSHDRTNMHQGNEVSPNELNLREKIPRQTVRYILKAADKSVHVSGTFTNLIYPLCREEMFKGGVICVSERGGCPTYRGRLTGGCWLYFSRERPLLTVVMYKAPTRPRWYDLENPDELASLLFPSVYVLSSELNSDL